MGGAMPLTLELLDMLSNLFPPIAIPIDFLPLLPVVPGLLLAPPDSILLRLLRLGVLPIRVDLPVPELNGASSSKQMEDGLFAPTLAPASVMEHAAVEAVADDRSDGIAGGIPE
jgi:hypothetical protein